MKFLTSLLSSSSQILILKEIVDQRLPTPYLMVAPDIFFSATLKWASQEFLSRNN